MRPGSTGSSASATYGRPFLILVVLGSMYGGFASPSEAAAIGVVGALLVSGAQGTLNLDTFGRAALGVSGHQHDRSDRGGSLLFVDRHGVPGCARAIANGIASLHLSPFMLILLLLVFYAILGCVLEGLSAIVMTCRSRYPRAAGRIRQDLVRHLSGDRCRDGADHATGRVQPLRYSRHDGRADRAYCLGDHSVLPDHGRVGDHHHPLPRSGALPAGEHHLAGLIRPTH